MEMLNDLLLGFAMIRNTALTVALMCCYFGI